MEIAKKRNVTPVIKRCIEARKSLGLNQTQFAEQLEMSRNFINRMEKGEFQPSNRTLSDICRKFSINENWLQTGEGKMESQTEDEFMRMWVDLVSEDEETKKAIMAFYKLSPEQRKEVWNVVKTLAKAITE